MLKKFKKLFAKQIKLPVFINTWNNRVIARTGTPYTPDLLTYSAKLGKKFKPNFIKVEESFFMKDLKKLLQRDLNKYGFITENLKFLDDVLKLIGKVKIPEQIIQELEWLKNNFSYNYHHIVAVTALSTRIARDFMLEEKDVYEVTEAAMLYDIGIGRVPLKLMQKVGKLSPDERNIINCHPIYSALLVAHYYQDENYYLVDPILNHHENLDGSGYPRNTKNNNVISHIIRISDTFDALISARPFRKFFKTWQAFKICEDLINAGKIIPEILPIIYSYYLFVNQYPSEVQETNQ